MFGVTIYGKSGKHTSVIHHLELFFDTNLMVMKNGSRGCMYNTHMFTGIGIMVTPNTNQTSPLNLY